VSRGGVRVGDVLLGRDGAGLQACQTGGDDERPVAARERRAERLDGPAVRAGRRPEVAREGDVVLEGEVDDAVGRRGGGAQAFDVVEAAAVDLGAGRGDRLGRGVGAGEADDLVAGSEELGDDGGADPSRTSPRGRGSRSGRSSATSATSARCCSQAVRSSRACS
jgi:hypothetical protein